MQNLKIEYPAAGQIRLAELGAPPDLTPTQIRIETRYSGMTNGTERHALLGEHGWKGAFPSVHGYQCVGQVAGIGDAVTAFKPGDWVFYGQYVGHRGWHVVDTAVNDATGYHSHLVMPLPSSGDYRPFALLGVAGVAMRGARRLRIGPADKVWVAGQGPIGHFAAQAARALGAHVTVTDVNTQRLAIAEACGAHRVLDARDGATWQTLEANGPYDRIVDACNLDSFLRDVQAHGLLAHHGAVGMLAVHSDVSFNWSMLHGTEASIEVSCHFSLDDLRVLLHFIEQNVVRLSPIVTRTVSIREAIPVYEILRDDPGQLMGVVFDWGC
ncbi:MAG: Zinc-binding alcohol dehydrogenase [Candidatus Hydrogenedentes bacterium]|nr:Zinc-binding alcohol dehydrogenase [Candidatus Hydrogenedentota bacterium]